MSSTAGAEVVGDDANDTAAGPISLHDPLERARRICGQLNAAHAELIDLVSELVADDTWAIAGIRSVEHWLTCFTAISPATARDLTCIATVPQLRRALVRYDFTEPTTQGATNNPPVTPDALSIAAAPAELSMHFSKDRFHLTYSAPADIGALVQQALLEAKDALFLATQGGKNLKTSHNVRLADAMEQLATRSLHIGTEHVTGRASKFRIYLHLNTDGQGWLTKRGALPTHLLRKWTCDGTAQPIWETHGTSINVGRAQRIVPNHTRRLIEDRDRGCTYPGCLAIHHLECHHIVHWADGGTTDMNNLISLCPHHHDRHHLGDFTIHPVTTKPGQHSQFQFHTRGGRTIEPITATPTAKTGNGNGIRNGPADDTDPTDLSEPPRYIGPTNEVLHLDWVRFYRRPRHPIADKSSGDPPADEPGSPA